MNAAAKRIVVVLGMHRSGTSTIARALEVLGVDLGDNLLPPAAGDNERGYWEDADVHALNMELLLSLGHDWHTLQHVGVEELDGPVARGFHARAVEVLARKMRDARCFGLKDPRISRLLPFWRRVFGDLGLDASYAIVSRNPLSVARSLARRDAFEPVKSHYLWLEHTVTSLQETASERRVVVDYDLFMDDLAPQLARMAERLGLPFDAHGAAFARFKDEFVSESLRHTRFSADDLVRDPNVPGGITALYDALQRLATDQPGAEDGLDPLLLALSGAYAALRPALAYMRAYEEKAANAAAEATARAQAMAALQAGVAARDAEAAALRADAATRDAEIARLREDVVRRESEMVVIGAGRSELAAALERCEGELRALRGRWEEMLATTWRIPRPAHVLRALRGRRENG